MLICAGDSITERRPWARSYPNVMNLGRGGDTTAMLLARWDGVLRFAPFPIHLLIGTNDPTIAAVGNVRTMALAARAAGSPVILCTLPPRGQDTSVFNNALKQMATAEGFTKPVDYWTAMQCYGNNNFLLTGPDFVHPNSDGYAVMDLALYERTDELYVYRYPRP